MRNTSGSIYLTRVKISLGVIFVFLFESIERLYF